SFFVSLFSLFLPLVVRCAWIAGGLCPDVQRIVLLTSRRPQMRYPLAEDRRIEFASVSDLLQSPHRVRRSDNRLTRCQQVVGDSLRPRPQSFRQRFLDRHSTLRAQFPQFRGDTPVVLYRIKARQPIMAALKKAEQGVVILCGNGVELV